ncbi:hypothetical protein, partial [Burkholderia sp. Ax-1724]|uniref:hypothetical protein n=1 Tax=Burkholderia sp. Ax-1724 TaxID=2608336 RepID=UPI0019660F65
ARHSQRRRERRPKYPLNNTKSWSNGWVRIQCKSWVRIPCKSTGYSFEEIADVISKAGVRVSVGTLKYALRVVAEEKKHSQISGGPTRTGNAQSSRKKSRLASPVRNGQSHVAPQLRESEKMNKPSITPIRGTFGFPISPDTENL